MQLRLVEYFEMCIKISPCPAYRRCMPACSLWGKQVYAGFSNKKTICLWYENAIIGYSQRTTNTNEYLMFIRDVRLGTCTGAALDFNVHFSEEV